MEEILKVLSAERYEICGHSQSALCARRDYNSLVRCEVNTATQDVNGTKLFVSGWLSVRENIGAGVVDGETPYWEAVGREVGPKGMFPYSSHVADGWNVNLEAEAAQAIADDLLPWLKANSQLDSLIKMVEDFYFEGERIPLPEAKSGIARVLLGELGLGGKRGAKYDIVYRPKYSHILGMLHYEVGNLERAAFFVNRWVEQRGEANVDPAYLQFANKVSHGKL